MQYSISLIALGWFTLSTLIAQNNSGMISINTAAPVQCSKTITINASIEKVWLVITNINEWSNWQTDIKSSKLTGQLQPQSTFVWKTGGATIYSRLHTVEFCRQFGWTGKTYGMYAIHNWTFTEANGQTTVIVHESMEGFLAKLFKKSFNKNLEKGMLRWLTLLKNECERTD